MSEHEQTKESTRQTTSSSVAEAATSAKATDRPWRVERDGDGKFLVVSPRKRDHLLITGVLANLTPGQDEANAALIVRAVNSHDALMKTLESIKARASRSPVFLHPTREFASDVVNMAQAALDKTKEAD